MIDRILEPELMDTAEDAREYDAMDHAAVNAAFVTDLIAATSISRDADPPSRVPALRSGARAGAILDLGVGTGQILIELCRRVPNVRVVAVDAAASMLALARENVAAAGLADRIELVLADAKQLPFSAASFPAVISNSIVHHIAEPAGVLAEAVRVATPNAIQFHRDLYRPADEAELARLVATYAGDATAYQQKLFSESLRAALTLTEIRQLVGELSIAPDYVRMTSDRHWTFLSKA